MKSLPPGLDLRRLVTSVSWAGIDQALFALSNLLVTLAVARGSGAEGLGRFTVAVAAYLIVLGIGRSLISEPLLAQRRGEQDREVEAATVTITVLYALAGAVVVGAIGLVLGRLEFGIIALLLPTTLVQDLLRYQSFRRQRPALAALVDAAWVVTSVAAWPVVVGTGSVTLAVALWGLGSIAGIIAGWWSLRPRLTGARQALRWWTTDAKEIASPLLVDSVLSSVASQALFFVVAAFEGERETGILRGGQVFFAPLSLALIAISILAVPKLAARPSLSTPRMTLVSGAAFTGLAAVLCLLIVVFEPLLRGVLYGGSIEVPVSILVPLALGTVFIGSSTAFVTVAKARRIAGHIARSRLSSTIVGLVILLGATWVFGIRGAAWSLAVQTALYTISLGRRVIRSLRSDLAEPVPAEEQSRG